MSFDPDEAFRFIQCAYRCGLLDNITAIQGEAMVWAMSTLGINQGDVNISMDDSRLDTITTVDTMLGKFGSLFKYLNNEKALKFLSNLLEVPRIRLMILWAMKKSMLKSMAGVEPSGAGGM